MKQFIHWTLAGIIANVVTIAVAALIGLLYLDKKLDSVVIKPKS